MGLVDFGTKHYLASLDPIWTFDMTTSIYDFSAKLLSGKTKKLSDFKGKALVVVNTASKCGLTPQYEEIGRAHV